MKINTALITGVAGFCAKHLANRLAADGFRVAGTDLGEDLPSGVPLDEYFSADICDTEQMDQILSRVQPNEVFHLAGLMRGDALDVYRVNLMGGVQLLESLRRCVPEARVLLVGSAAEYGVVPASQMPITEGQACSPRGVYGLSKYALTLAGLDYARQFGMNVNVARPFNIIGPGIPSSLVVGAVLHRVKAALSGHGEPVVQVGNLSPRRDFIAVEDVVDGFVRVVRSKPQGEVFNLCSGQPHSIQDVVTQLLAFAPRPIRLQSDDALARPSDVDTVFGDSSKAREYAGFRTKVALKDSLRAAWDYVMEVRE